MAHGIDCCGYGGWYGQLEERERDGLPLHSRSSLPSINFLFSGSVLHLHSGVDRLVTPQVVAVLKLLVTNGADVSRSGRSSDWFYRRHGLLAQRGGVHRGRGRVYVIGGRVLSGVRELREKI